jgi:hypothetical protein
MSFKAKVAEDPTDYTMGQRVGTTHLHHGISMLTCRRARAGYRTTSTGERVTLSRMCQLIDQASGL